jgi:hypothetical protein
MADPFPDLHVCEPPLEPRPVSAAPEWRCPACGAWWDVDSGVPPEVLPAYGFTSHQEVVPARWIPRAGA